LKNGHKITILKLWQNQALVTTGLSSSGVSKKGEGEKPTVGRGIKSDGNARAGKKKKSRDHNFGKRKKKKRKKKKKKNGKFQTQ